MRQKPLRFAVILILLSLAGFFAHGKFIDYTLVQANRALSEHRDDDAKRLFARSAGFPFSKAAGEDGLGALALLDGDEALASRHFQNVLMKNPSGFGANPKLVMDRFIGQGIYQRGQTYRDFLLSWKPEDQLRDLYLDFATLALGTRELAEARRMLSNVDIVQKAGVAYVDLQTIADDFEQTGEVPVVLDSRLRPVVVFDLERSEHLYAVPRLFAGWPAAGTNPGQLLGGLDRRDQLNRVVTTLDLDVQRCAYQAMKGFEGAMVLLDPRDGDVLAAYGSTGIDPFSTVFEPGSVVKLITFGYYLQGGGRSDGFVPKRYPASEQIAGRIFYDWTQHGQIETIDEAMAVSCNLIFAHMGIEMGWPKLKPGLRRFFDNKSKAFFFSAAKYGSLKVDPQDDYQLGRAAIGLDHTEATALGLAVIPATIANGGVMPNLRLITSVINLRNEPIRENELGKGRKVFQTNVVDALNSSMRAALSDPRGTARNVSSPITIAAKTGTAGERPYDAIMVGYAPADDPQIAFGFVLAGGGKAEINGAKVTTELMRQLAVQAPKYLE